MTGDDVREGVRRIDRRQREKDQPVAETIPPSTLWLACGSSKARWQQMDLALAMLSGKPLGTAHSRSWLVGHADEIARVVGSLTHERAV